MIKFATAFFTIWLICGIVAGAAENAIYQFSPSYFQKGCWVKDYEWQHTRHELFDFAFLVAGPIYFLYAFVDTGIFSQGVSFHIGTPVRCSYPSLIQQQ